MVRIPGWACVNHERRASLTQVACLGTSPKNPKSATIDEKKLNTHPMMMDQFDGILRTDDNYYAPQPSRRSRHYVIAGASLFAFVLLVVVSTGKNPSSKSAPSLSPLSSNPSLHTKNGGQELFTFQARHPPAGVYEEEVSMKIHEDMSTVADGLLGDSMDMDVIIDSTKTMTDRTGSAKGEQSVKLHITRMRTHLDGAMMALDCDTTVAPTTPQAQLVCAKQNDVLKKDLEYLIDEDGDVTPVGHSGEVVSQSRLAQNPVQHVTNKLKFLPVKPVAKGETWQSRLVLGDIGDYVGTTTLQEFTECGVATECALISSVGTAYVDPREAAATLGVDDNILQGVTITESTLELTMHWNEDMGMIPFSKMVMKFKVAMDGILGTDKIEIPVHEEIITSSTKTS